MKPAPSSGLAKGGMVISELAGFAALRPEANIRLGLTKKLTVAVDLLPQ